MAVDSAAKRASAHRAASWPGRVLPIPDNTVAAADRAHVEGFYGGLFAAGGLVLFPITSKTGPALGGSMFGKALQE